MGGRNNDRGTMATRRPKIDLSSAKERTMGGLGNYLIRVIVVFVVRTAESIRRQGSGVVVYSGLIDWR